MERSLALDMLVGNPAPTVLIVDDAPENLELMAELLRGTCRALVASSGVKALALAASARPDLIVLDVVMPDPDGFEVCRRLKSDPSLAHIPVIFLTASHDADLEQRGLELGAVDFVGKPVRPAVFRARVRAHLELKRAQDDLRQHGERLERLVAERTAELDAQRATLQAVLDETPDAVSVKDQEGKYLLCNEIAARRLGVSPRGAIGRDEVDFGLPLEAASRARSEALAVMASGRTQVLFDRVLDETSGAERHLQSVRKPFLGPKGAPRLLLIDHDVTELRFAQRRLEESEQRLRHALDATGEGVWDWDITTDRVSHSARGCELLGLAEGELDGTMRELDARFLESERALIRAAREACLRGEAPYRNEHAMIRSDGRVIRVLDRGDVVARDSSGAPLRMVGSFSDITAQSDARDLIARSLREKEVLLKEIHHRVKNNLQIISSLISMQADSTRDERARGPLLESAARVRSMALIHRQLYASSDLAHIDLGASAHALASELLASLAPDARADVDVENVAVTVEQAVPCALLLNELLSNAAKHGRSEDGTLAVRVEVKRVDGEVMLAVSDRGPGLPEQVTFERGHSLGMTLVRALARQLRATIRAERREGTRVELRIKAEAS